MAASGGEDDPRDEPSRPDDRDLQHHQVQVSGATARVPESVGKGVFGTGAIVMIGQHNFVMDFVQQFGSPAQLVGRVVMPHAVLPQFVAALEQNLAMFTEKYGSPPPLPRPENPERRSVKEIYDNLKLPDEELSGSFAEAVMIRHSAAEFCFDFITRFFPHASVSSRVFLASSQVPPLLKALKANLEKLQGGGGGAPPNPPDQPPP
jgi:hypothetical protein